MSQQPLQAPWSLIEHGPNNTEQMYSNVADLYHEFRPRYPESLIDHAIQRPRDFEIKIQRMSGCWSLAVVLEH